MNIGLISNVKYERYLNDIKKWISSFGHKAFILNRSEDLMKNCDALVQALKMKRVDCGVTIDDYGTLPFMFVAKHKGMVVAQIADEHSAHMTRSHNNANVLSFGGEISTLSQIYNMIASFLKSTYEGGRHEVRINMLNLLLEGQ